MLNLNKNDNHVSELDAGKMARMLVGAFEIGVMGHEVMNRRITRLSREIIYELLDMSCARKDVGAASACSPSDVTR